MTACLRSAIVAEARTWIGTRFAYRGYAKGIGADCIGFVYGVARSLELCKGIVIPPYPPRMHTGALFAGMERNLIRRKDPRPGSVASMRFEFEPTHLAIFGDHALHGLSLIHGYAKVRKVVEHGFDATWRGRLIAVYDFHGIEA